MLAVDCEMMGLNIHRDRLCLVQLGDEDRNVTLVQIEQGQKEAPNLKKLLEAAQLTKLFHYARTDIAWLKEWLGIIVAPVFCTKIASKIARTYSDKHGLKDLCKEVIGKELNKNQQSSDWGASIINDNQKQYAANDVLHLHELHKKLSLMLEREGKIDYLKKCCDFVAVLADLDSMGYSGVLEH